MWLRTRLMLTTITGNSMVPAFTDGDRLLISRHGRYAEGHDS